MDKFLTEKVRKLAYDLGADLVGFANVERFSGAPIDASPQGLMPTSKTVVVVAIHHPDAVIDMSGHPTVRDSKSYYIQMTMCDRLEHIAFEIAKYLENEGYMSIPTNATNSQIYRPSNKSGNLFLSEISHRHAAAAAGLGEFGYSGLFLTPEYGPRNRFMSIITEAPLEPSPLYKGPALCDKCGECIRHCPPKALSKEVNGMVKIQIEDKIFEYANKNIWRCAWIEHWELDINKPVPEKVNQEAMLEAIMTQNRTGGSVGQCLKYCMPPTLRYRQLEYQPAYRRKPHVTANRDIPVHRNVLGKIRGALIENGIENLFTVSEDTILEAGIGLHEYLPDGKGAIAFRASFDTCRVAGEEGYDTAIRMDITNRDAKKMVNIACEAGIMESCRILESFGYAALPVWPAKRDEFIRLLRDKTGMKAEDGTDSVWGIIITDIPFETRLEEVRTSVQKEAVSTEQVVEVTKKAGADLIGIASARRASIVADQLKPVFEGDELIWSQPIAWGMGQFKPDIKKKLRKVLQPEDYIPGAKSVITIGVHFPYGIIKRMGKPPAENFMPGSLMSDQTLRHAGATAWKVIRYLRSKGYKAVMTYDLFNCSSYILSITGEQYDATANNLLAPISGIGEIAKNGTVMTPQYGITQRFVAIVTDAELDQNAVFDDPSLVGRCSDCETCVKACPTAALSGNRTVEVEVEGKKIQYIKVHRMKCDWAKRYGLVQDEGTYTVKLQTHVMPSEEPDEAEFVKALEQLDPLQKMYVMVGECCILNCPYSGRD